MIMTYNNYNNTNQPNQTLIYSQNNNTSFNNKLSNSYQNLNNNLNSNYNYQNSNYPVSMTYYQNNLNTSFMNNNNMNNSFNNNNQYQNNNMNLNNNYQNLNYRTTTTYTPNNFNNNNFQNNNIFSNKTYQPNYTMTNSFNNYQNQNNGYNMSMSYQNLNNNYQNLYNTMIKSYPNIYTTYQNNLNNFRNNTMSYSQNFANNQQMFNNMTPQNTKNDIQIVEEILNYRRNLEKTVNEDETTATILYYRESIRILTEILNNRNRNTILDNTNLVNLLNIVNTGYSEYMKLGNGYYERNIHRKKIIQIYVFLKFIQESQDIGKNKYFIESLRHIEAIEKKDRFGFIDETLGADFGAYINRLDKKQIKLLNLAIKEKINDQYINYFGYTQNENTEYYQYGYNNNQKSTDKIDEEVVEDILKYRKTMEEQTKNIDLKIENYHNRCSEIINELSKDNDYYLKNTIIPNLTRLLAEEKEKYEKLYNYYDKEKYKEEIIELYVLLKFLQESQDIGKNENFKKHLATLSSKKEDFGFKYENYIFYLNDAYLLNLAKEEEVTERELEYIKKRKHKVQQEKHMIEDKDKIEKDEKIINDILAQRKQIERTYKGNKQLQTKMYYFKCVDLIVKICKDPKNFVLNKGKINYYKDLLRNNYNIYEMYASNMVNYYGNAKENIEKNFMKMFVLLSLAYKSENLGKNKILIDEIRKMDSATIETTETEKIIDKFIKDERIYMNHVFFDFDMYDGL